MISSRLYLDTRRAKGDKLSPLRIIITKNGKSALISTGIKLMPSQWKNGIVINHPEAKFYNRAIAIKKSQIDRSILELSISGQLSGLDAHECAQVINEYIDPSVREKKIDAENETNRRKYSLVLNFEKFISLKNNAGTIGIYRSTIRKIKEYCATINTCPEDLQFDDINKSWLTSFENFCLKTEKQNTASIHLRNIRAVFNAAIDDNIISHYPFRKYKIRKETSRDKSFSAKELRNLLQHECYPGGEQEAADIFKLMFCLIGINCIDLAYLTAPVKGRIEYTRAKTHKFYSIKLQPEAIEIINKYKGKEHLLDILERCPNYKTYFNRLGKTLRKVGKTRVSGKKSVGEAILPDVCTGSARTSWATIAQEELDIPRDVIAAALGHHTVDVTSTYLRTNWKNKIDEANRKVLDWVFYGKK